MDLQVKRVYEPPAAADGQRVLVDRLWPRGISRQRARIDLWVKDIAPSDELRRWYGHDPGKWEVFRRRYFAELDAAPALFDAWLGQLQGDTVTLLYGSKEARLNNAHALAEFVAARAAIRPPGA